MGGDSLMGDGSQILTGAGIGAIVFILMKAGDWLIEKRKGLRADTQAEWKVLWDTAQRRAEEQDAKIDAMDAAHREEMRAQREREERCMRSMGELREQYARSVAWIEHVQEILIAKKFPIPRFRPNPGDTGEHTPSPDAPAEEP